MNGKSPLIRFTDQGLYCPIADIYIDPWKPVGKAIITHAHSDHARIGSHSYICHPLTLPFLRLRLGENDYQLLDWGEDVNINGVKISLHPAGHIIGSSQVRLEYKGEVAVVSGDYKTVNDEISGAFEPIACHTFITESTFGLPVYQWEPQEKIYDDMRSWVLRNQAAGKTSVLLAYSLGKAQRVLQALLPLQQTIYLHGAVWNVQQVLPMTGLAWPAIERITPETPREKLRGAIVIAPPGADGTSWMKRMEPYATGVCSGWMQVRGNIRRRNADKGFVLSDHADWGGLLEAVTATGAEKVFVTHGFQSVFSRYLKEKGIDSEEVKTAYSDTGEEPAETISNTNE